MVIEMKRISTVFALVLALVWGAACGNGTTTPTTPTTGVATSFTQVMSGDIAPGATPVHTFSVPGTAPLHMMLGSLLGADGLPLGSTVTLVYGVPSTDGLTCTALTKVSTPVALQAQINVTASSGGYCVGLEDTGSVADATHYAIRVIYGTPSDETSAGSFDHTSTVLQGGTTSRTFGASVAGIATITMTDFAPASVAAVGLGVGFQRNDATGCEVSATTLAARGATFSVPVDAGKYCVKVFDPGTFPGLVTFTIKISHP